MDLQLKDKTYLIINGQEIIIPRDKHWCPVSLLFGVKEDGSFYPVKITTDGELVVATDLQVSDIQIGAVEIKDDTSDIRLNITQEGLESVGLKGILVFGKDTDGKVKTFLFDNQGQLVVSSPYLNDLVAAINQKLDVSLSTRASEQTLSQIKQNTGRIPTNPATEDGNLNDILQLLKMLIQSPLGRLAIDSTNRLRTIVEGTAAVTQSGTWNLGNFPIDQRWEMVQRANIEYNECQRSKFTFV
jgi:hypothetical protein